MIDSYRSHRILRIAQWLSYLVLGLIVLGIVAGITASAARAQSIFADGFESPYVAPPPIDPCAGAAPANLVRRQKTWQQAFSSPNGRFIANFPFGLAAPVPLGAGKNEYLTVPFTPFAGLSVNLTFDAAQPNNGYGYGQPRVNNGGMFVGISPCSGDMRPFFATPDQWYRRACRVFNTSGGVVYSTLPGSNATVCRLVPGVTYWLTVSPHDPADLFEETCSNPAFTGCDVQTSHSAQVTP